MADESKGAREAKETPEAPVKKKKRSKLPIFIFLILLVAGGGFFVLKTKHSKPKEKPKIELAEKETDLDEFLTNTGNAGMYVRAKISVTLRKDYPETKLKDNPGDVRDAVIAFLNATSPTDIMDGGKRTRLKKMMATVMNAAIVAGDPAEAAKQAKDAIKKPGDLPAAGAKTGAADKVVDWDSETGPIMKVRFTSLATQ